MPSKVQLYAQMADRTAEQITGSYQKWTAFLTTAARLYKYPYNEQLMIFAQRPEATACAEYDLWNKQMRRYVRRGSKGIALVDTSSDQPKLRYVFDVSDTSGGENSRRPYLWEYRQEHREVVSAALEQRFDVSGENGLADQMERVAAQLVDEYWHDNRRDIVGIVRHTAHEVAVRMAVNRGERHAVDFLEEVFAQAQDDALAQARAQAPLEEEQHGVERTGPEHPPEDARHALVRSGRDGVDGLAHKYRCTDAGRHADGDDDRQERDAPPLLTEVAQ